MTTAKTRWGFNVGLFTEKLLTNSLYVSPEIGYTTKGSSVTFKNLNTKNNFNLNYAELSLPFTYKLNGVNIQLGPYLSYLINVKAKTQNETTQVITEIDKSNYNNFDAGFLVGLNLDLTPNIAIGTRYGLGFVKIARTDASRVALGDARNMVGQISIAYKF